MRRRVGSGFGFLCPGLGALLACVLAPALAGALELDARGDAVLSKDALWTQSFESGEPSLADAGADAPDADADAGDAGVDPVEAASVDDAGALHGARVLTLEAFQGLDLPLPGVSGAHAFQISLWARGEVVATLEALRADGHLHNYGVLYPTGRITSDGWVELSTRSFSVSDQQVERLQLGVFAPSGASVDALELRFDSGFVPEGPCRGVEDGACAPGQLCAWGTCRNLASRVPPLPEGALKDELVDYMRGRFQLLFGPYKNRKLDLPAALLELEGMRQATDAWSYFRHMKVAVHRLHDWHTTGSDISQFLEEDEHPLGVCFIEGVADVSQNAAPSVAGSLDVLVSHVAGDNVFGLQAGDRLVAVDGKPPVEWTRSLIGVDFGFWTASNHDTHAEDVARLPRLISRYADRISVIRCDATSQSCGSVEELSVSDLPVVPEGSTSNVGCDNRPVLHLPDVPAHHPTGGVFSGIVVESNPQEAIYGLHWSSLSVGNGSSLGILLQNAVQTWRDNARGVILDHRTGYGGTTAGPPIIWNFVREPKPLDVFVFRQRADDDGPKSLAEGKAIFDALLAEGEVQIAGSTNPALDVPVALLVHLDGSASDWLPLGVKGAPKARIFGPYATAGAFSTLLSMSYWASFGYSIAVGDTLVASGDTLNGTGVEPDQIVLQRQSDLLAGKDTVYDAALAWVRQELQP